MVSNPYIMANKVRPEIHISQSGRFRFRSEKFPGAAADCQVKINIIHLAEIRNLAKTSILARSITSSVNPMLQVHGKRFLCIKRQIPIPFIKKGGQIFRPENKYPGEHFMRQRFTSLAKIQLYSLGIVFADFVSEMIITARDAVLCTPLALFGRALLANPRAVGACCPSSARLAHAIASQVLIPCNGFVVELGGGTGAVTAALLQRGVAPDQLVVIEQDRMLAKHLKNRFPDITVINGNAARFSQLLNRGSRQIKTVVSSLPLLSLPAVTREDLGKELQKVFGQEGTFIQYTYRLNNVPCPMSKYVERTATKIVWKNLPPAKIEVFRQRNRSSNCKETE